MNALQAPYNVAIGEGPGRHRITLRAGRHFRLYPIRIRADATERLSARMIDFLRLSLAVVVVDGLLQRKALSDGFRRPVLEVEVLDPAFWECRDVADALKATLDFLSGDDDWHVRLVVDHTIRDYDQQSEFNFTEPTSVCLYSGGLDSAAGLAAMLREQPNRTYMPIVVRHQFFREKLVKRQFALLKERYRVSSSRFLPLFVASFVRKANVYRDFGIRVRETSHRCRSFLFTALAGVVAAMEGSNRVEIYESGIGAVNLPLKGGMSGWRTTRSTHPSFLRTMSLLVSLVVGRTTTFELPFMYQTKASLVEILRKDGLSELALSTVSCIVHPLRRGNRQCGTCPACVFRRYAMQLAEIPEPREEYRDDLFGSAEEFNRVPKERLSALQAFLWQAVKLAELDDGTSIPEFFRSHLLRTKVVLDEGSLAPFVDLFRRYRREWLELATRGQSRRMPWADRLVPRKVAV